MRNVFLLFFFSLLTIQLASQALTPTTILIPTSNGDSLEADLYLPNTTDTFPTIFIQTPYNKFSFRFGLPLGTGTNLSSSNYAFVILDWRGRFANLSKFDNSVTRGEDGFDAIEWMATQPWCNGKIGTMGPSALGNVQYETAKQKPPHLVCAAPSVASPHTRYIDYYTGGALKLELIEQLDGLGFGVGSTIVNSPFYNFIWTFSENTTTYPSDIEIPMLKIGGWFDQNINSTIFQWDTCTKSSVLPTGEKHHLLVGPWVHGGHGTANVGSTNQGELNFPSAANYNTQMEIDFFDYHLRNIPNNWNLKPPVMYFQMGDNQWLEEGTWPPTYITNETWFLQNDLTISKASPNTGSFSYSYNPTDPSPTVGGATLKLGLLQGPYNQVDSVESRNDNAIFSTNTLTFDLKVKGTIKINLFVSSDKKDTDFGVRLTDVYPDGRSILLNETNLRMRFRNGFTTSDTASMVPGTIYPITLELPNIAQTFKSGHKMRIIITSSNYPKRNRNMNNGEPDMYPGNSYDSVFNPQTALNSVFTGGLNQSNLVLPVDLTNASINENRVDLVTIHPNPTSEFITISDINFKSVALYSHDGRYLSEIKKNTFSLKEFPSGEYFIRFYKENGGLIVRKVVKLR